MSVVQHTVFVVFNDNSPPYHLQKQAGVVGCCTSPVHAKLCFDFQEQQQTLCAEPQTYVTHIKMNIDSKVS